MSTHYLPPDIFAECEDILFQICDDPFEVKLRANYEVRGGGECPTVLHCHLVIYS